MKFYDVIKDLKYIQDAMGFSDDDFADIMRVDRKTVLRWKNGSSYLINKHIKQLYDVAYNEKIRLNAVKNDILKEKFENNKTKIIFHGAKQPMDGDSILFSKMRENNDFGRGFYCGESFEQSATFVYSFPNSSVYTFKFDTTNLNYVKYSVTDDWMLLIAYYRGWLDEFKKSDKIMRLVSKIENSDYVIAPIADNRMFDVINEFTRGEITDVQCRHCLSATNLGNQFVFRTKAAVGNLECLCNNYISEGEKKKYEQIQGNNHNISVDKLKYAKREFRNQGKYIEELL